MKEQKDKTTSKDFLRKIDLQSLSMDELMALAEKKNISDKWDLNKNGLIRALEKISK